jgi:phosphoribosylglycinamide formyltransferase 1
MNPSSINSLAVFASGSGTNAENLIRSFGTHSQLRVNLVISNNPNAGVIERAKSLAVPVNVISRENLKDEGFIMSLLNAHKIDHIILAGFLWLIPEYLIRNFKNKIFNIHPALLPNYGGKGMYGMNVHRAVLQNGEKQSGITIHVVDPEYDKGRIIDQFRLDIDPGWTAEDLQREIHELEYQHFPNSIQKAILNKIP